MPEFNDAYYVDGVGLSIGHAKDTGYYAGTRADDLSVRAIRACVSARPDAAGGARIAAGRRCVRIDPA